MKSNPCCPVAGGGRSPRPDHRQAPDCSTYQIPDRRPTPRLHHHPGPGSGHGGRSFREQIRPLGRLTAIERLGRTWSASGCLRNPGTDAMRGEVGSGTRRHYAGEGLEWERRRGCGVTSSFRRSGREKVASILIRDGRHLGLARSRNRLVSIVTACVRRPCGSGRSIRGPGRRRGGASGTRGRRSAGRPGRGRSPARRRSPPTGRAP
jgi:hypothetical protein